MYNPALRSARAAQRIRAYHPSTKRRQQESIPQRYGTANEPPPHLGGGKGLGPSSTPRLAEDEGKDEQAKALPKIGERLQQDGEEEVRAERQEQTAVQAGEQKKEAATMEGRVASPMTDPMLDSGEAEPHDSPPGAPHTPDAKPMQSVLNTVPYPTQYQEQQDQAHAEEHPDKTFDEHSPPVKAPHMEAPRYVHHFDTYGLVKRLTDGGWNEKRAITAMKAMRLLLADNTDLAKEALVSKSNLENEAYLFKAACAELKTEVTSRRKAEQERMRTERTQLQHEVDILSQRLGQEGAGLKDELKGMFDDRKMAVRNEQRNTESKVQQLNYRITVSLQADAKSEVEGLRWIMTRRVILTLGIVVMMILGSLKLYSSAAHDAEEAAKRRPDTKSGGTQTEFADERIQTEAKRLGGGEVLVKIKEGDNPAFVSLG